MPQYMHKIIAPHRSNLFKDSLVCEVFEILSQVDLIPKSMFFH